MAKIFCEIGECKGIELDDQECSGGPMATTVDRVMRNNQNDFKDALRRYDSDLLPWLDAAIRRAAEKAWLEIDLRIGEGRALSGSESIIERHIRQELSL